MFVGSLLLLAASQVAFAQGDAAKADVTVAFKGATIHTAAGPKIEAGVLVVAAGKIVAVGGLDTPIPTGAKVIDATGKTILPGLVDTHSHVGIYPRPAVPGASRFRDHYRMLAIP